MKKVITMVALLFVATTGTALADADYASKVTAPSAKANTKAVAKIKVESKGAYHVNKEFPTKLTLEAPAGVTLEKAKQTAKDAVKLDDKAAEFEVAFTSSEKGKKEFKGELKFALCDNAGKECLPKSEKISFTVDVK
jgi:hypothetical protein